MDGGLPGRASRFRFEKVDLDNVVDMDCADSMVMIGQNMSYMYGDGKVTYGELKLDAAEIRMDLKNNTVYAQGAVDSIGEIIGKPVFSEGGTDYETQDMSYNFKTKRGYINNVITQQGEGYLTGGQTKKLRMTIITCRMQSIRPATITIIRTSIFSLQRAR